MDTWKAVGAVFIVCAVLAARLFLADQSSKSNPEEQKAVLDRKAADERAIRLSSKASELVAEARENFQICFPEKPRRRVTILVGLNGGSEIDWDLNWHYDSNFSIYRRYAEEHLKCDDPTIPYDRWFVNNKMKRMVERNNLPVKGKPEEWKVQNRREFTIDGKFEAVEFTYTYQKVINEAGTIGPNTPTKLVGHDRSGRRWIVKVPGTYYVVTVEGEPDVPQSPLANSFFSSFHYTPPAKAKSK